MSPPTAAVVGAGVFGAATARCLAQRGWRVTLIEQYAPGTVRSASGGDTRLLRVAHGGDDWYARSAQRARLEWLALQEATGVRIFEQVGVAFLAHAPNRYEGRSGTQLENLGVPFEWMTPKEASASALFPSLRSNDLEAVLFEPEAGVLHARRATQLLVEDGMRLGVQIEARRAVPAQPPAADVVIWACGAWLPGMFPAHVPLELQRREVFFFGGDGRWNNTPGFCEFDAGFYGHGDIGGLGFKIGPDSPEPAIDPDSLYRLPSAECEQIARRYLAHRFPQLAEAPVLGGRVCQYVLTPDTHFLVDQHPERPDWWLVGGGSGHGFKHGPALGEYVADCVSGARQRESFHSVERPITDTHDR